MSYSVTASALLTARIAGKEAGAEFLRRVISQAD
jgi:hypothetical protein